jgi:hypothetical protein
MVCLRNVCINTLHKGDSDDDDDDDDKPSFIRREIIIIITISEDRNVIKKEAEKILKYKDLIIEIQRMWNVKTRVIPVIIGATGTISKSVRK